MEDRNIPSLDDRNARSWRVPNDPSPKAKVKITVAEGTIPSGTRAASTSGSKMAAGRTPASACSETSSDAHTDVGSFKNKLRSRMWKLLFNNVDRSVDELYYFCEDENDHQKTLDAVQKLRGCLSDFEKLVTRSDEQKRFENGGQSVSWDVRKTSVGVRRSQVIEVEEYGPVNVCAAEITRSVENSPSRKGGHDYVDLKTPEAKSKLRALAKPFEPSVKERLEASKETVTTLIDTSLYDSVSDANISPSTTSYRLERVQMDTSPSASAKPEIREVTIVMGSPPRLSKAPSESPLSSPAARPLPAGPIKAFSTPPANRSASKKVAPLIVVGALNSRRPGMKQQKKSAPTVGNARSRAASESRVAVKPHSEEEDRVVTEEMAEATNAVWAEAEAWIEAEFRAEEIAWKLLETSPVSGTPDMEPPGLKKENSGNIRDMMSDELDTLSGHGDTYRYSTPPRTDAAVQTSEAGVKPSHRVNTSFDEADIGRKALNSPTESSSSGCSPAHKYASLHDKLSSPERRKLTPAEARQRLDERLLIAEANRSKSVSEIKEKAMAQNSRVKEVEMRTTERLNKAEQSYAEKLRGAEKRHDDYIKNIKDKAGNENAKVSEVLFINSFNEKVFQDELNARLNEVENRILAGRHRKEQLLLGIQDQRRKRNNRKAEQMSELRLNLERKKMERWEALQLRLKTVQDRRLARLEELQRRTSGEEIGVMEPDADSPLLLPENLKSHETAAGRTNLVNGPPQDVLTLEILNISPSTEPVQLKDFLEKVPIEQGKKIKSKKNKKSSVEIDEGVVLEMLVQSAQERECAEAEQQEFKFQLLSSRLPTLCGVSHHDVTSSERGKCSFFSEAAKLAAMSAMDPFSLMGKSTKDATGSAEKNNFFLELQAAVCAINVSSKKKRKKSKALAPISTEESGKGARSAYSKEVDGHLSSDNDASALRAETDEKLLVFSGPRTGKSCLQYKSEKFVCDILDFIKKGLKLQDTAGLSLSNYTTVVIQNTPDVDTINNFIDSGGILACVAAIHRSTGLLHNERSLRIALDENIVQGTSHTRKCSLALLVVQAVEWCCRSNPSNVKSLAKSPELVECLIDFSSILLQAFSSWHLDTYTKVTSGDSSGRTITKKDQLEQSSRTPVKDGTKAYTPQKGLLRRVPTTDNSLRTDGSRANNLPNYMCILLPVLSSLTSIINMMLNSAIIESSETVDLLSCQWIGFLLSSNLLQNANEAMRDLHAYTDLQGGLTSLFHSIIYEVSDLIKAVSKLITTIRASTNCLSSVAITDLDCSPLVSYMNASDVGMASNLVQVLSALLLRDLSAIKHPASADHPYPLKSPAGIDKGTGISTIGSGWDKSQTLPPPQVLCCSFKLLEALNAVAMVDVLIVQSIPEVIKVSLVHTSSLLLIVLFQIIEDRHWKDKQATDNGKAEKRKSTGKFGHSKSRFEEPVKYMRPAGWCPTLVGPAEATLGLRPLFIFLGYFCLTNTENQSVVARGTPPSLLLRLCRMPIRYLTDERLKHQILPTLIAMCANNPMNIRILHSELSPTMLTDYLERLLEKDKARGATKSSQASYNSILGNSYDDFDPIQDLKDRIPQSLWPTLIKQLQMQY